MTQDEMKNAIVGAIESVALKAKDNHENSPISRKAVITKSISRLIATAPYENITITTNMQIEVFWQTPEELMKKSEKFNSMVIDDYKKTEKQVVEELKIAEKKAFPNEQMQNRLAQSNLQPATSIEGFDGLS